MKHYLTAVLLLAASAPALAQDKAEPPAPQVPAPATEPVPAPQTPANPPETAPATPTEAAPATTPATTPTEAPKEPPATTQAPAPYFADAAAVDRWIESYYQHPDPQHVVEAFRTLDSTGVMGRDAEQKFSRSWSYVGFFWACMSENAALMAQWCSDLGPVQEPARTWWWTAVWMSQTDAGNAALREAMDLPPGHANRIAYKWLADKPRNILQTPFRGTQQANMLWMAFYATGNETMIYKLYEGFVPAEPKPPTSEPARLMAEKQRQRNQALIESTRASFAANLLKHPKALEICKKSIEKLRDPVKSEITKLVADAEAALAKPSPESSASTPPETKPDAAPAPTPEKTAPETPATPPTPPATPEPEPKPETAPEPKPETKPETAPQTPPAEPAPGPR